MILRLNASHQERVRHCVKFFAVVHTEYSLSILSLKTEPVWTFAKNRGYAGGIRKGRVVAIKAIIIGLGIMGQRMLEQMIFHLEFVVDTI